MANSDLVKEVKNNINIVELVSESTNLTGNRNALKGLCPFHNEKTPSFVVYPEKQTWRCFGACASGGDIFNFIMNSENINFPQALSIAADKAGIKLNYNSEIKRDTESIIHANEIASSYFQSLIKTPQGENAKNYLINRGIDEEIILKRGLGVNYEGMNTLADYLKSKSVDGTAAIKSGLLVKWNNNIWKDAFTNRITIEIRDENNKIVGFGARALGENHPKYINTRQTQIFNKSKILYGLNWAKNSIKESSTAVIVEGYFDVITAHEHGFTNVVGCMGTSITDEQLKILNPLCSKIILSLDADDAGKKATYNNLIKIISNTENPELLHEKIYICDTNEKDDPDQMIRENPESWKSHINNVKSLISYLIENIDYSYNLSEDDQLIEASQSIYPIIISINNSHEQNKAYDDLAKKLKISRNQLQLLPKPKVIKNQSKYLYTQSWQSNELNHESKLDEALIHFLINNKELIDSAKTIIDPKYFSPVYQHIYEKIISDIPLNEILENINNSSDDFTLEIIGKILNQNQPSEFQESKMTIMNDYIRRIRERYLKDRKIETEKIMKERMIEKDKNSLQEWDSIMEEAIKDNLEIKTLQESKK
ncbi:MAG: DNA primase [Dehalococcoidia bacterium]|jgi:DNA primase|nr:DNA primase [Dehalococcoidia bacterium]